MAGDLDVAFRNMEAWHFEAPDGLHALTTDERGGNLPQDLGPWASRGPVTLSRRNEDEREAISLLTE